jgi:hypothetical protein
VAVEHNSSSARTQTELEARLRSDPVTLGIEKVSRRLDAIEAELHRRLDELRRRTLALVGRAGRPTV